MKTKIEKDKSNDDGLFNNNARDPIQFVNHSNSRAENFVTLLQSAR